MNPEREREREREEGSECESSVRTAFKRAVGENIPVLGVPGSSSSSFW
jgi:hypothetical protein